MDNREKIEKVKELLRAKYKEQQAETVKTSDTPQEMTPLERENARRRKIASQFDNYITDKLLPGLKK